MRATRLLSLALLAVLLAGCGSSTPQASHSNLPLPSTSSSSAPTSSSAAGPSLNQRGNLVKQLGEPAGITDQQHGGATVMTFTVDSVQADPRCDGQATMKPEQGHFLAVHFRATTANLSSVDPTLGVTANNFDYIDPQGLTHSGQAAGSLPAFSCMKDSEKFPQDPLGDGQQYAGMIVLDEPGTTGTLVFKVPGPPGGWEWAF